MMAINNQIIACVNNPIGFACIEAFPNFLSRQFHGSHYIVMCDSVLESHFKIWMDCDNDVTGVHPAHLGDGSFQNLNAPRGTLAGVHSLLQVIDENVGMFNQELVLYQSEVPFGV